MAFLSVWGVLGERRKFSQADQKDWIELPKWRCFYVTQKIPCLEGKRSLGSNGTPLTVRFVNYNPMLDIEVGSQRPWSKDTLASGLGLESQLTRLSTCVLR